MLEEIGHGSCGTVYRGLVEGTGRECAIKVFDAMAINRQYLSKTLQALFRLPRHPNVIRFFGGDLDGKPFHVATEYLPRSLANEVYEIDTKNAWNIIAQLTESLAFLHRNGLSHCNLSLDNVRLAGDGSEEEYSVRIADVGTGLIEGVHHLELAEHPFYLAPEQLRRPDVGDSDASQRWDVYSFGVLAYRLIAGEYPRGATGIREFIRLAETTTGAGARPVPGDFAALLEAEPEITWPEEVVTHDGQRLSVLGRCLALDPAERFSDMRDVAEAFRDVARTRETEGVKADGAVKIGRLEGKLARKKVVAATFAVGLLVAALAAGTFFWRWQEARKEIGGLEIAHSEALEVRDTALTDAKKVMSEALIARDVALAQLAAGEEAGERLFAALLEMNPEKGGGEETFAEGLAAAADHFERVLERGSDAATEARASENLGNVYLAQGRAIEALPLLAEAAEALSMKLGDAAPTSEDAATRGRFGRIMISLATLALAEGKPEEAREQATRSLVLNSGTEGDSSEQRTRAALEMIRARASVMLGDTEAATESYHAVIRTAETLANAGMVASSDRLLACRARSNLAELQLRAVAGGDGGSDSGPAAETAIAAIESLLELRALAPKNPAVLRELGHAYTLAGIAVSEKGLAADASVALSEAVKLLSQRVESQPEDAIAHALLGEAYSETCLLAQDLHGAAKAAGYAEGAVDFLEAALAKAETGSSRSRSRETAQTSLALAIALARLADLKGDLKDPKSAASLRQRAATILDGLAISASTADVQLRQDIATVRARLAEAHGHAAETSGDKAAARAHFELAATAWSEAGQGRGAPSSAAAGSVRTRTRLAGLPE